MILKSSVPTNTSYFLSTIKIDCVGRKYDFNKLDKASIKLLVRLRVGFSHLRESKLRRSFQSTEDLVYSSGIDKNIVFTPLTAVKFP